MGIKLEILLNFKNNVFKYYRWRMYHIIYLATVTLLILSVFIFLEFKNIMYNI